MVNDFPSNVVVVQHPLISNYLSIIRDKSTSSFNFRITVKQIINVLCIEATKNLVLKDNMVETPLCKANCQILDEDYDIFIVPILRAGLIISEVMSDFIPNAKIQHLGMYRNEKTLKPVWYYNKLPQNFKNTKKTLVYICDPMLATGGTVSEVVKLYINEKNIPEENITFINLIASKFGINKLLSDFPKIKIITSSIDNDLNENSYIVPGLGDAGDRIFNTIY